MQPVSNPATPVLIALATRGIAATQEGAAHAAIDQMVPRRGIEGDERGAGLGHGKVPLAGQDSFSVAGRREVSNKWVSFIFFSTEVPACCRIYARVMLTSLPWPVPQRLLNN